MSNTNQSQLLNALLQVIHDFEEKTQERLRIAEEKIVILEAENQRLRGEVEKETTLTEEITDEVLQKRLISLGSSPLDTLIRESGVVFEDRLRKVAGDAGNSLTGVQLVDAVLAPEKGVLIFSKHPGEQQGVHMLYRGAMQFIRNPPMHNIIEYQAGTAQILIRLIDSLLKLLAEARLKNEETTNTREAELLLADVRRMLVRRPIPYHQMMFYKALYGAGETGVTGSDLAKYLNKSRPQLAGVLGALGLRVNGTEGLENKGGLQIIVTISRSRSGDYLYRMKPILRKALEQERVVV
ncbi:MAG: TIGR02391 family protein [Chloroflexota bacterium]|nr:TIGR02391 family protein [Chloroflexota bacterium]